MRKKSFLICISLFFFIACSGTSNPDDQITSIYKNKNSVNEEDDSDNEERNRFSGPFGIKGVDKEKEIGDIVFKDGTSTPYSEDLKLTNEQKAAAIAIIFYKGTELNSWDDESTERILGVGLKHSGKELNWCSLDIDYRLQNENLFFRSIECPVTQKDDKSFTFSKKRNGSDNFERLKKDYFANDETIISKFPAFSFAENYSKQKGCRVDGTVYSDGWYLPSIAELYQIYACSKNGIDINAISIFLGGDSFLGSYYPYWSSSTKDKDTYALDMRGLPYESRPQPEISNCFASNSKLVCVIREFD